MRHSLLMILICMVILSGCGPRITIPSPGFTRGPGAPDISKPVTGGKEDPRVKELLDKLSDVERSRNAAVKTSTDAKTELQQLRSERDALAEGVSALDVKVKNMEKTEKKLRTEETEATIRLWGLISAGASALGFGVSIALIFMMSALAKVWKRFAVGFGIGTALSLGAVVLAPHYIAIGWGVVIVVSVSLAGYLIYALTHREWALGEIINRDWDEVRTDPRLVATIGRLEKPADTSGAANAG